MKTHALTLFGFYFAASLSAQGPPDTPPVTKRTSAELIELLGPIALYPDALISLILPASTVPADVVMGARFVASAADLALLDDKPWDSSVKALTRYPDTLHWLDDNLEWTAQVGDAFVEQPVEVMETIQTLRAKARALGNLVDTPEQKIVQEAADIRIIPAQPEYIYEPRYDPEAVYVERPVAGPLLFFSAAHRIGAWLNYEFDWNHHRLYRGERHDAPDSNRLPQRMEPGKHPPITNRREWQPDSVRRQSQVVPSPAGATKRGSPPPSIITAPAHEGVRGQTKPSRTGVAQPMPIASVPRHGEVIRRAGSSDGGGGKPSDQPPAPHSNAGKPDSKPDGHSGKGKSGSHQPKSTPPESRPEAQPMPKETGSPQSPAHKKQDPKPDEPKHKDSPKHAEPKHDSPKSDASNHQSDEPKKKGKKNDKDKSDKDKKDKKE